MATYDTELLQGGGVGRPMITQTTPRGSTAGRNTGQVLQRLTQFLQAMPAKREADQKKEKEAMDYYAKLRAAGYAPEVAEAKTKEFKAGGFLSKILGGAKDSAFERPELDAQTKAEAAAARGARKEEAEIGKIGAEAAKATAEATRGGLTAAQGRSNDLKKQAALRTIQQGGFINPYGELQAFNANGEDGEKKLRAYLSKYHKDTDLSDPDLESAIKSYWRKSEDGSQVWEKAVQDKVDYFKSKGHSLDAILKQLAKESGMSEEDAKKIYGS